MNAPLVCAPISHNFSSSEPLPPRRGRPLSCTPAKVTAICALIRGTGISDTAAGALAGVSRAALSRAKQEEDVEVELGQARAQYLLPRLSVIAETRLKDGQLDWRAQAWLIKFSNPEEYGPPSRRRRLEKVELPEEERAVAPGAAPSVAPSPSMAEVSAAPRRAEMEGERENVTFRSEIPAETGDGVRKLEARGEGAPAPREAPMRESVTIRSDIPTDPVSGAADLMEVAGETLRDRGAPESCSPLEDEHLGSRASALPEGPGKRPQSVTIRSEIRRAAAGDPASVAPERLGVRGEGTTGCPDVLSSPEPQVITSTPRVSRRARRAEQRQQAREAWRASRQERAA